MSGTSSGLKMAEKAAKVKLFENTRIPGELLPKRKFGSIKAKNNEVRGGLRPLQSRLCIG